MKRAASGGEVNAKKPSAVVLAEEEEEEMLNIEREIDKLNRLFDTIQAASISRQVTEEDRKERVQRISIGILELKNRLFLEGMTDRGQRLLKKIDELKRQLIEQFGIKFEHVEPEYETTLAAARNVLEVWEDLGDSEFSKLDEVEQAKLERIIQHYLPDAATIFLQTLYPTLPDRLKDDKVREILSANISFFMANARCDLPRVLGVTKLRKLKCGTLEYYSQLDPTSDDFKILTTAIRSSIQCSNTKLNFADTISSIIETAVDHPYRLFKIIAGSATVVAASSSIAPVATVVGVAAGDAFAAAAANPQILAAIQTMCRNPASTGAGLYYVVQNAKSLLTSLNTQFGIDPGHPARREIQTLFNRIDRDWMQYQQAGFVGPVPDSILNFYDAYLTLFSFVKKTCWNEAHNFSQFARVVFKVPKAVSDFCCRAVEAIGDRFNQFERWMRPAGEQTKQRMRLFHDTFRKIAISELTSSTALDRAFASLAESDDRPILFEVSLERWKGIDAVEFPENYAPISETLQEVWDEDSPPRDDNALNEEINALPYDQDEMHVLTDDHGVVIGQRSAQPPVNDGQGPPLHKTLSRIRSGQLKASDKGGSRRRRKATTKKQKSKKNKRQSRRKVRRSSSRRSRK